VRNVRKLLLGFGAFSLFQRLPYVVVRWFFPKIEMNILSFVDEHFIRSIKYVREGKEVSRPGGRKKSFSCHFFM
jgi:hypothetical protein